MDLRLFEAVMDPIIAILESGHVQYVNSAGLRWLAVPPDAEVVGKTIDNFVLFEDTQFYTSAGQLQPFAFTDYEQAFFRLRAMNYSGLVKVSVQKLPYINGTDLYVLFVRDKIFMNTTYDDQNFKLNISTLSRGSKPQVVLPPDGLKPVTPTLQQNFADETLAPVPPSQGRAAVLNTKLMITLAESPKTLKAVSLMISDQWFDVVVGAGNLTEGAKCNIEVVGTNELKTFSTSAMALKVKPDAAHLEHVRLQFGNLGPLAKNELNQFLNRFAFSL